jgi:hypothetical protein
MKNKKILVFTMQSNTENLSRQFFKLVKKLKAILNPLYLLIIVILKAKIKIKQ